MNNFLIIQVILNMIRHLEDVSPPGVNVMRMMGIHVYVTMSRKITGIVNQIGYIFQHGKNRAILSYSAILPNHES